MKVLLLQDVENLGLKGEIVRVKDGYARNYLIPRGLARAVTPSVLKAWEEERRQKRRKLERERKAAEALAQKIQGTELVFTLKVGPEGKPFGSVTTADILKALEEKGFEGLSRGMVRLRSPLRDVGRHEVTLRLYPEVTTTVIVDIRPEVEASGEEARKAVGAPVEEAVTEEGAETEIETETETGEELRTSEEEA